MQFQPKKLSYPDNENPKLVLLENLFAEWHQYFFSFRAALKKHVPDDFVSDGFYPNYYNQKKRILFIGRESRGITGENYLDVLYPVYRGQIKPWPLNSSKFHARMLRIAYGILHGMPEWKNIPSASLIGNIFGEADGLSFAFMNFSKFSNDGGGWPSDWGVINAAHKLSTEGRNFLQDEIAILEPDIIISMTMKVGEGKIAALGKLTPIHSHPIGI